MYIHDPIININVMRQKLNETKVIQRELYCRVKELLIACISLAARLTHIWATLTPEPIRPVIITE